MMMCNAILGDAAVPASGQRWRGEVCAVFEHSVHLKAEGRYFTLGAPTLVPHPYSILWNGFAVAATVGLGCTVTKHGLTFENGESLNFRSMQRISPVTRCGTVASQERMLSAMDGAVGAAVHHAEKSEFLVLAVRQKEFSLPDASDVTTAMHRRGGLLLRAVREAIREGDYDRLAEAAEELAGFGPGLTPTGDDILAGVFSSLRFRSRSGLPTPFTPDQIVKAAIGPGRKTSEFSGFLLTSAASGEIALPLADWLDAVHRGDEEAAVRLVDDIAGIGHTSGLDCLAGMVLALRASMGAEAWTE